MNKQKFEEFTKEMLPLIEKMIDVSRKYNPGNELIAVTCSMDGYFELANHSFVGDAFRVRHGGEVKIHEGLVSDDVSVQ